IPLQRILDNLRDAARIRPLVIQSLFMRVDGAGPPPSEIAAYCDRLNELRAGGGAIDRVQGYTVARRPAEEAVTPLSPAAREAMPGTVRQRTSLPVEAYP